MLTFSRHPLRSWIHPLPSQAVNAHQPEIKKVGVNSHDNNLKSSLQSKKSIYVASPWNAQKSASVQGPVYSYIFTCVGILEQSMGTRNRVGKGLSYRRGIDSLESIPF
jgi:hypothetical protein